MHNNDATTGETPYSVQANDTVTHAVSARSGTDRDHGTGGLATGDVSAGHVSSRTPTRATQNKIPPATVHRITQIFNQCVESIDRAIGERDGVLRENAFAQLIAGLDGLWGCRSVREGQFKEVVNLLQNVVVGRKTSDFNDDQLATLKSTVEKLRAEPIFDDLILDDITDDLIRAGIDAFRELA